MSSWIQRVGALFGGRAAAPLGPAPRGRVRPVPVTRPRPVSTPAHAVSQQADTEPAVFVESLVHDPQVPFFEWLLGTRVALDQTLQPKERRLLGKLDAVLAAESSRHELLPRAPAVIPQLMNSLRDDSQSAQALADRVAKDPNLVAEVLRLANSSLARATDPVSDLPQAISRLGTQGLRRAIARVVLKPIFDAPPDSLSGRAAPRLWLHSEAKATECLRLATQAGLEPFEGYLAGLMHNVGWTAALRALDKATEAAPPSQFSRAFVEAFEARRDGFFAMLVVPWQLTAALTALAIELRDSRLAAPASPLGRALRAADRSASFDMLGMVVLPD